MKFLRHLFFKITFLILFLISYSSISFSQTLIVALGDSLTEGFGVDKEEAYPYLVEQELLRDGHPIKIINAGVSGSTSASATSRLKWYARTKPDMIIIALGGNDGLRGLSVKHMKQNLTKAIELAQSKKIKVLLAGMQLPLNYGTEYRESFTKVFNELAKVFKIPIIPFLLEDVGGIPSLNLADGIHPNPDGHKIIAQTVLKYLKPLLLEMNYKESG